MKSQNIFETYRVRIKINFSQLFGAVTLFVMFPPYADAENSCSISSISTVSFGNYNVFSALSNSDGVGSITIQCQNGAPVLLVKLSSGQSNSYVTRMMKSGVNILNYNLYTSAARNIVWGDGSGGSSAMSVNRNSTTTLNIFGQIPAGQDAAVGVYTDNITTTINF